MRVAMSPLTTTGFFVAAISAVAHLTAQPSRPASRACELLSPTELGTAVGGSLGPQSGSERPYKKNPMVDHDGVLYTCSQTVGVRRVTIVLNKSAVTAAGKRFAEAGAKGAESALKEQGFQVQAKEIGGSRCMTIRPPAGSTSVDPDRLGTNCVRETASNVVSVTVGLIGAVDAVPMEKVAALAEKAASRVAQ
jgi:hypothetical protein